MAFRVPPQQVPSVKKLLEMSAEKTAQFARALAEAGQHFNVADLSAEVAQRLKLSVPDTLGIVTMLAGLYLTRNAETTTVESFVDEQVFPAVRLAKVFSENETDAQWAKLRTFFLATLPLEKTLGTAAKAGYVLTQHERIFVAARILTDIRPVFHVNVSEKPESALLVHMLRITERDGFNNQTDKYFALDSNDIRRLRGLIERALKKEETLKNLMKDSGVTVLNPKDTF